MEAKLISPSYSVQLVRHHLRRLQQRRLSQLHPFQRLRPVSKLELLYLHKNKLVGSLPESLNMLENLTDLFVGNNSLTGPVRFGSANCKNLLTLELSYNEFEGGVPPELGNCSSLDALVIVSGNLSGTIPASLGKLKKLESLELFENRFSGEIPIEVWKIQSLSQLLVYQNNLTGELPLEMTELKHLKKVTLFNNGFYGEIPSALGVHSSLEEIDFISNKLTGEIPNLCHGKKLTVLNLGSNQLHGKIPTSIGRCKSIERPSPEFSQDHSISFLDFNTNSFEGPIPRSFGSSRNLSSINLSRNKLSGQIPSELGNLLGLGYLNLSNNLLQGSLPSNLSNCVNLERFDVGFNKLNGTVPSSYSAWKGLATLILSENLFTGGIPSFLPELVKLSDLQMGRNAFGGEIPSSIGSLQQLIYGLDLSGNGLTGELPDKLKDLIRLTRVNVSNNKLTGSLSVLGNLTSLLHADVSNNQFIGPIPEKLKNQSISDPASFSGNPNLCIPRSFPISNNSELSYCEDQSRRGRSGLSTWKIVLIAVLSSLFVLVLVLALVFICLRRRGGHEERPKKDAIVFTEEEGPSLLLNKVLAATDNLNEKHIIGRGAHGIVYRASLGSGEVYAVKRLIFASHIRANQSMMREIETIGKVRHRNLIKLEGFWLRKEDGLMLYRYMPGGSLYDVLHGVSPKEDVLEWSARYNVALGVAHGLAYLHYDCHPPIVHRDIKPENILMDSDLEPHIGDFGLARLLDGSTVSTATVTGTTGYIAPENAFKTVRGRESDVYSYGVVLLELVTRKRAVDKSFPDSTDIVSWVRSMLSSSSVDDMVSTIVDPVLADELLNSDLREQIVEVTELALSCTERDPARRPTMREVVKVLCDAQGLVRCPSGSVR
ncbi:hypothetical protein Bca52824_083144 [Brassica carinata]|uniref:non-specific serine/threonine protein kinase n=1 Tax=Brassica carinata TaxID=52824 RepID=A0A8X7PLP8_BRACI|nr:hypothetical protein Bca52824_083144 [Brassica carinata]